MYQRRIRITIRITIRKMIKSTIKSKSRNTWDLRQEHAVAVSTVIWDSAEMA